MRVSDHFKWRVFVITGLLLLLLLLMFKNLFDEGQVSKWISFQTSRPVNSEVYKHIHSYDPKLPTDLLPVIPETDNARRLADIASKTVSNYILNRLNNKTGGFFIEAGAYDGFFLSNTLLLEQDYGWTGLLVEADPEIFPILIKRNRKALVADVCLSLKDEPMKVKMGGTKDRLALSFIENDILGSKQSSAERKFEAQCYPLHMLLDAIGRDYIDYFSLDVEGVELDILKTIPWDRIRIKIIGVEFRGGNRNQIREFLESKGYRRINSFGITYTHDDVYELVT